MNLWQRLTQFFGGQPAEERAQLSETENEFLVGATPLAATEFDRPAYSRQEWSYPDLVDTEKVQNYTR